VATTTAGKIIKAALRRVGLVETGQEPTAEEYADGLEELNMLLSSLSAKGLMIPARTKENFTLTIGTASYTIGSGGSFDTTRPDRILDAFIRDASGNDNPVAIFAAEEYNDVAVKSTSGRPTRLYYKPAYPLGTIYFDFTPASAETLYLDSDKPLTELASKTTSVSLPDAYKRMLVLLFAITLHPGAGEDVPPSLMKEADDAMMIVENLVASSRTVPEVDHDTTLLVRRNT